MTTAPLPQTAAKGTVLNFSLTPPEIGQLVDTLIARGKKIQDDVAAQTNPTFESVIVPLAMRENNQGADYSVATFLQNVSTDKEIRDASTAAEEKLD
ncbi:metalloendopeptidase, partial [Linderina macrospora]